MFQNPFTNYVYKVKKQKYKKIYHFFAHEFRCVFSPSNAKFVDDGNSRSRMSLGVRMTLLSNKFKVNENWTELNIQLLYLLPKQISYGQCTEIG